MPSRNFWKRLFSSIPIKSDANASFAVTGTLAILRPPFEKNPPSLF